MHGHQPLAKIVRRAHVGARFVGRIRTEVMRGLRPPHLGASVGRTLRFRFVHHASNRTLHPPMTYRPRRPSFQPFRPFRPHDTVRSPSRHGRANGSRIRANFQGTRRYDIAVIGDLRFPGGTASGAAEQIRAQAKAGYRTALIHLKGPVLKYPHPFNPNIRRCIDEGLAELVDPDVAIEAPLALAYHPQIFTHLPHRPPRVTAETQAVGDQPSTRRRLWRALLRLGGDQRQRPGVARRRGRMGASGPAGAGTGGWSRRRAAPLPGRLARGA